MIGWSDRGRLTGLLQRDHRCAAECSGGRPALSSLIACESVGSWWGFVGRAWSGKLASVFLAIVLWALAIAPGHAQSAKRQALIVANAAYQHTRTLDNPGNDARLVADKLKALGFGVRLEKDVDARKLAEILDDFVSKLDKETAAVFYYAGHGLQFDGENFLVGVDAKLKGQSTLQFEAYKLNTLISVLESRAGTSLLFWDACRDNPLADGFYRSVGAAARSAADVKTRSGAAIVPERRADTLIVFSAEPGKVALDGQTAHSPFAEALARHIETANLEVEVMLKRVQGDVQQTTRGQQRPERLSKLQTEFYFNPSASQIAAEQELQKLKARLAELEGAAGKGGGGRFRIVGLDDPSFRKVTAVTSRSVGAPAEAKPDDAPAPPPPVMPSTPPPAAADARAPSRPLTEPNIVIAVNHKDAAVVRRLRLSPDGQTLAVGDDDGLVHMVRLDTFEVIATFQAHAARISDLDFSPDSGTLLTAGRDGALRYWDVAKPTKARRELKVAGSVPFSARINNSNPERWVVMGDERGNLVAWDNTQGRIITQGKFHEGPVHAAAYQPGGGGTYFSAGADGNIRVRLAEGQRYTVKAHEKTLRVAAYSHSGRLIYSAGDDRKVKVWPADTIQEAKPEGVLEGHLKYILAADMTPSETLLATGGGDKVINLWDVVTKKLVGRLKGHTSDVEAISFAPNGKFIVSASEDQSVRIWSVETQEELVRLFFRRKGNAYTGVTIDNQLFGDRESGLVTIYVNGRAVQGTEADEHVKYIGRGISIIQ